MTDCLLSTPDAAADDCSFTTTDGPMISDYHPDCYLPGAAQCEGGAPAYGQDATLPVTGAELWFFLVLAAAVLLTVGALLVRYAGRKIQRDWLMAATTLSDQYEQRPS